MQTLRLGLILVVLSLRLGPGQGDGGPQEVTFVNEGGATKDLFWVNSQDSGQLVWMGKVAPYSELLLG